MHTKHDLGGTSSPKANIRGTDLRPALIDAIVHGIRGELRWCYLVIRASSLLSPPPPFGTARGPIGEGAASGGRGGDMSTGGARN